MLPSAVQAAAQIRRQMLNNPTANVAPSALQRSRAEPPEFSCYQQGVATDS
jgi:hypothetical protein